MVYHGLGVNGIAFVSIICSLSVLTLSVVSPFCGTGLLMELVNILRVLQYTNLVILEPNIMSWSLHLLQHVCFSQMNLRIYQYFSPRKGLIIFRLYLITLCWIKVPFVNHRLQVRIFQLCILFFVQLQ